jgi:hypothetical protein
MTSHRVRLDVPTPPQPDCAVCGEPIRWCLDMHSYTLGTPHELAHARCVWRKAAFREQERQAEE